MRSSEEVKRALRLFERGCTPTEVARTCGIPRSTVREWHAGRALSRPRDHSSKCTLTHDLAEFDTRWYGYLLGLYLGDGHLSALDRLPRLRITLDSRYTAIVRECVSAIEAVSGRGARVHPRPRSRCVDVSCYWKHWPCLIPQHGPGRKHLRPIILSIEQERIVMADPRPLLRGLIHSDGTRIIAVERKGSNVRYAPRYAFKNRSEDILHIFCRACSALEVHFTRPSATQIAIYRKASVARLDEFVGPKT